MGNNNVKKGNTESFERHIDELFSSLSGGTNFISLNDLKTKWSPQLDPHLYEIIESHLNGLSGSRVKRENFKSFFIGLCKSNPDDRSRNVLRLLGSNDYVSEEKLLQFVVSVVESVLVIQRKRCAKNFNSWSREAEERGPEGSSALYGRYLLSAAGKSDGGVYDADDIRHILTNFDVFLSMTLAAMYETEDPEFYSHLLPAWRRSGAGSPMELDQVSILDPVRIMFINLELPVDFQSDWRLLFSSLTDGESFSRLAGQITNKGPTIAIVKDKGGHVFGGFAPDSWNVGPNFKGDSSSFLFTLHPEMKIFASSNFNSNYQYMNTGQQTMPNGLGMGGKLEYFGMWLSAEFGLGTCSESCTTYRNYKMMSSTKSFTVAHLEVWGVGQPPPTAAELGERSVLDGNVEAKAILELAGKQTFSEGYRDKPKDLDAEPS